MLAFIFYGVKPTDDVVGIFPLLDVCSYFHVINNFFHKLLADFKTRYNLHNSSFRLPHKRSTTTLSEHLWTLKDAGVIHETEWTILDKAKPCSPAARKCDLCLAEKYHILLEISRLLNKRSEIFGTCPHRRKHLNKIRIAATKKIQPDEYLSTKQICCRVNLKMGN